jgi:hypothetical protein
MLYDVTFVNAMFPAGDQNFVKITTSLVPTHSPHNTSRVTTRAHYHTHRSHLSTIQHSHSSSARPIKNASHSPPVASTSMSSTSLY